MSHEAMRASFHVLVNKLSLEDRALYLSSFMKALLSFLGMCKTNAVFILV